MNRIPIRRSLAALLVLCVSAASAPSWALGLRDPFGAAHEIPVAGPPRCADDADIQELDLFKAIDVALCRNPQTKAAWATARVAAANLGQAKTTYLPTVGLDADIQRSYAKSNGGTGLTVDPVTGTTLLASGRSSSSSTSTSYGPELTLNWLLFDFGGREATVESARQAMLEAGWNYGSDLQNLVFNVIRDYANIFSADEALEAAKLSEKSAHEAFEAAQARLDVGVVTPADTAQAETAYSQAKLARQQAENTLNIAHGTFNALLHWPPTRDVKLKPLNPAPVPNPYGKDVDAMIDAALKSRPDLAAIRARRSKARADLHEAEAYSYPSISLSGGAGRTDYTGRDDSRTDGSIGIHVSVPIFTGFSDTYRREAARHDYEAATQNLAKGEDDVALDVWTAYHNHQTAKRTYDTAKTLLKSAQTSQDLALGRYRAGTGTLIDVLSAQASLADARRQWVDARYNILVTRYDLARSLGNVQESEESAEKVAKNNKKVAEKESTVADKPVKKEDRP